MIDKTERALTRQATADIIHRIAKQQDDACLAVQLIEHLYISDPSPEIAKEIINILNVEVHDAKTIQPC